MFLRYGVRAVNQTDCNTCGINDRLENLKSGEGLPTCNTCVWDRDDRMVRIIRKSHWCPMGYLLVFEERRENL